MSIYIDILWECTHTIYMNSETLNSYLKVRRMRPSELARRAGLTRQAVSRWLTNHSTNVNVYSTHLQKVAEALSVRPGELLKPLPILSEKESRHVLETKLLWDKLYPDLEAFIAGLIRSNMDAIARLVQVFGLYQSEKIIGQIVWTRFQQYKTKIHPSVRKTLETLWALETSLNQNSP